MTPEHLNSITTVFMGLLTFIVMLLKMELHAIQKRIERIETAFINAGAARFSELLK